MMKGMSFLGKCPRVPRSDLFKSQDGNIYRKTRGTRELELVERLKSPGDAPVAYSTRKRMGKAAQKHVESKNLTTDQVKHLDRTAKRCGFASGLRDVVMDYELQEVLKVEAACIGK